MSANSEALHFTFKDKHAPGQAATVLEADHMLGYATSGTTTIDFTALTLIVRAIARREPAS